MNRWKVVISDYYYKNLDQEKAILASVDAELLSYHCKTEDEVIQAAADCDALICQFAPITRRVIESLRRCKVIVRYAIGVDNIDLKAAEECGIIVCNVPDYSIDEVSNHVIALLLDCCKKLTYMAGQTKLGNTSYNDRTAVPHGRTYTGAYGIWAYCAGSCTENVRLWPEYYRV